MPIRRMLRAKVVAGAALTLLFGSGVVVGLAWDETASASTPEATRTEEPETDRDRNNGRVIDRVGLSEVQNASVDSLVAYYRGPMRDLNAEFRPRYRAVIGDLREAIKEILTDEQRAMYEVLLEEHDAKHHSRRSRDSKQ